MSTNSGGREAKPGEQRRLRELAAFGDDWGSILVQGPAMTGKQDLAIDLLATAKAEGGQPIAITTSDTATQLRQAYASAVGGNSEDVVVVDCVPGDESSEDDWTRRVESPGDLTGIAMVLSEALQNLPARRREGARVLVDNVATSLMYTDTQSIYRFLHALIDRVDGGGGAVVSTLDTDGIDDSDYRALVGLFDTVVEARRSNSATEFSIEGPDDAPDGWYRQESGGAGQ